MRRVGSLGVRELGMLLVAVRWARAAEGLRTRRLASVWNGFVSASFCGRCGRPTVIRGLGSIRLHRPPDGSSVAPGFRDGAERPLPLRPER